MTRQRLRLIPFLVSTMILFPSAARSDGMVYVGDMSSLRPLAPHEQAAAIICRGGVEKMVIALNYDAHDEDSALWIFPVLGTPSQTKVEILDSFPQFRGSDPRVEAGTTIRDLMQLLPATQIWTWPVFFFSDLFRSRMAARGGISVSGEAEKWGIHAEIISAKNVDGLIAYLKEKHTAVEAEHLRAFEPYLGGGYVLVAAWIASRAELVKTFPESEQAFQRLGGVRRPALYVEFPTETAYFPLRPTATYGEVYAAVRLWVAGYVAPRTNPALAAMLRRGYYDGKLAPYEPYGMPPEMAPKEPPQAFNNALGPEPVEYTAVQYEGLAGDLTDDLRFVPTQPPGMRYAHLVLRFTWTGGGTLLECILIVAGLSYLAAGLAGLLARRQWHRYALFGLWNLLTILGFLIGLDVLRRREGKEFPAFRFFAAFTLTFVALSLILSTVLASPIWSWSFDWSGNPRFLGALTVWLVILAVLCAVVEVFSPPRPPDSKVPPP